MLLCFNIDGLLQKYGWQPGAGSGWDTAKTVKELRFFREMGFEVVENVANAHARTNPFFHFTTEEWRQTRAVVEDAGLRFHSNNARRRLLWRQPAAEEDWQSLLHIAKVSEWLGLAVVDIMVAPPLPFGGRNRPIVKSLWTATDRDFEVSAKMLKEYARRLGDFGAELTLEIHVDTIHDCAPSALRLMRMIDEPNVGVNPDTLDNAWLFPGEDVPGAVEQAKMVAPHVNHWHVKQYTRTLSPDGEWRHGGAHADEGTQPIGTFAQLFVNAGFDGAAYHECGRGADRSYAMKRFCDYFRWLLDEYIPNVPVA